MVLEDYSLDQYPQSYLQDVIELAETGASYMCLRMMFVGIHYRDIPSHLNLVRGAMWSYVMIVLYNPTLALVKCSVLSFLYRLAGHEASTKWWIISVIVFTVCQGIATLAVTVFQCRPIEYFWLSYDPDTTAKGQCIQEGIFYILTAVITILTDLVVLALPFHIFMRLQLKGKIKLMVICLFMLGGIVTIVSVLRLVWIIEVGAAGPREDTSSDPTYDIRFIYSEIETCLAIITACGPSLRPLAAKWFPKLFSTLDATPGQYNQFDECGNKLTSKIRPRRALRNKGTAAGQLGGQFPLKDLASSNQTEVRTSSPTGSEDEIISYHGIIRTMDFSVRYEPSGTGSSAFVKETTH
ncbi:hypothetical protein VSDG_03366 [Cytospora chrysosperma]|uniref:Rhodopsin domain-containing protein n=1 Tax=Cytospora chrysosperma TaxID=252740 RepID=A0A423WBR7_CYTCH|nr:hypothetical protein VSDG_03366 [Valsa sordida]